eukprot:TRINITY_DN7360_c0_g1_i1.p2 TRINITY_DN7360_c0_g1~~TRINITY_DN7360_c0_g1_i1.p2  ORF type:complete len:230 (+),score=90.24 TRINITY_DN7360_c0_g1_i1:97-786(+)
MTSACSKHDAMLADLLGELAYKIESLDAGDRGANVSKCADIVRDCKKELTRLNTEIRGLPNDAKADFTAAAESHRARLKQLENALEVKKKEKTTFAADEDITYGTTIDDPKNEVKAMLGRQETHQNDALSSLGRTLGQIQQTNTQAASTAQELARQGEVLEDIDKQLDELGDDLTRAKKELNAFMRRMATDRLILCFLFLIVLGIVVAVILHFVLPANDKLAPPPPPPK